MHITGRVRAQQRGVNTGTNAVRSLPPAGPNWAKKPICPMAFCISHPTCREPAFGFPTSLGPNLTKPSCMHQNRLLVKTPGVPTPTRYAPPPNQAAENLPICPAKNVSNISGTLHRNHNSSGPCHCLLIIPVGVALDFQKPVSNFSKISSYPPRGGSATLATGPKWFKINRFWSTPPPNSGTFGVGGHFQPFQADPSPLKG